MIEQRKKELMTRITEQMMSFAHISKEYHRYKTDYGLKQAYEMDIVFSHTEIHILSAICEKPGISGQELAVQFRRTRSYISQLVKHFAAHQLVTKKENAADGRYMNLYPTKRALLACQNHAEREQQIFETIFAEFEQYSVSEIALFDQMLEVWLDRSTVMKQTYVDGEK